MKDSISNSTGTLILANIYTFFNHAASNTCIKRVEGGRKGGRERGREEEEKKSCRRRTSRRSLSRLHFYSSPVFHVNIDVQVNLNDCQTQRNKPGASASLLNVLFLKSLVCFVTLQQQV